MTALTTENSLNAYMIALNKIDEKVVAPYRNIDTHRIGLPALVVDKHMDLSVVKNACEGLAAAIEGRERAKYAELKEKVYEKVESRFPASPRGDVVGNRESTAMAHLHKVITLLEGARARFDGKERELARVKKEWEATKAELENAKRLMKEAMAWLLL